MVDFNK
jgi:hypothetical protein